MARRSGVIAACLLGMGLVASTYGNTAVEDTIDYVNGMGRIITDTMPLDANVLRTGVIASFLGLPEDSVQRQDDDDDDRDDHRSDLDDAPEVRLQEAAGTREQN